MEYNGIFSWIDTNIENACEKTYVYVTMINALILIYFGVYEHYFMTPALVSLG